MMKPRIFVKLIVLAFFLVGVSCQLSNAAPIGVQVLDSYYHVSTYGHYDFSSTEPIYVEHSSSWTYMGEQFRTYQMGSADLFDLEGAAFANPAAFSVGAYVEVSVFAEWKFIAMEDAVVMEFNSYDDWLYFPTMLLRDMDTGKTLSHGDSYKISQPFGFALEANFTEGDVYSLSVSGNTGSSQGGHFLWNWSNVDAVVPEPATMLLLGSGLIGLLGLTRKFKK